MPITLAEWSVMLLCLSMACAIGGGLYEHIVLTPNAAKLVTTY